MFPVVAACRQCVSCQSTLMCYLETTIRIGLVCVVIIIIIIIIIIILFTEKKLD